MIPVISLAGFTLPVGPLAFLVAVWVGSEVGERVMRRLAPAEQADDWKRAFTVAAYSGLAAGLVGARFAYVTEFYPLYMQSPRLLLSLRPGMLSPLPGLVLGLGVFLLLLHRVQMPTLTILDTIALIAVSVLLVMALGQLASGARYGMPTVLPWGIKLWGEQRHPVQAYEAVALAVILLILWRMIPTALPGEIFWFGIFYVGIVELFLEAFRSASKTVAIGIRVPQIMALVAVLLSLYIISLYAAQRQRSEAPTDVEI
ncbi:MAG: prolipoprotein diacylglyceryl transferase [Anaerolineae bacterium]|nr:prolipoprotein diacylglyceryl transferase [Anaerolineae bacterium]